MLTSEPQTPVSNIRRLELQVRLPSAHVLRELRPTDVSLLKNALAEPVEYIAHELLDAPDAARLLMGADSAGGAADEAPPGLDDSGIHSLDGDCAKAPDLDPDYRLFLKLNHCRRQVYEFLERHNGKRLGLSALQQLLPWLKLIQGIRSEIVSENVALVLAMAKRTRIAGVDLSDLISEGNLALLRSANKFDCSRGYRFSTYACRAILKSFSRVATRASRYRGHFPTEFDPTLEKGHHTEQRRTDVRDDCVDELRSILDGEQGHLSEVERRVIRARFALDDPDHEIGDKGKTLEQVGELIGVTKERVRQIQNKALLKLRAALDAAVLA